MTVALDGPTKTKKKKLESELFVQFVAISEYPKGGGDVMNVLHDRKQHAQNLIDHKVPKSESNVM